MCKNIQDRAIIGSVRDEKDVSKVGYQIRVIRFSAFGVLESNETFCVLLHLGNLIIVYQRTHKDAVIISVKLKIAGIDIAPRERLREWGPRQEAFCGQDHHVVVGRDGSRDHTIVTTF